MAMIDESDFFAEDDKFGRGIAINEHNGEWSLITAKRNKAGEIWPEFAFPQVSRDTPSKVAIPMGLPRMSKTILIAVLEDIVDNLKGTLPTSQQDIPDDDIPF